MLIIQQANNHLTPFHTEFLKTQTMPTYSKSLAIFILFALLWLENKAHRCGCPREKTHKECKEKSTSTSTSTSTPASHRHHQTNLTPNATLEPVNVSKTMTFYITRCQKVEIALTCLSVCQQQSTCPTTTSLKRIVSKRRELYAASILFAMTTLLTTFRTSEHRLQHQTNS